MKKILATTAFAALLTILLAAGIGVAAGPATPAATVHYVAKDALCGGPLPCYEDVQDAVEAAANGDTILVATGVYTKVRGRPRMDVDNTGTVTQVVYLSKSVAILGGYTTTNWVTAYPLTQVTTLDAQSNGRVIYVTGNISVTLRGLRIQHGIAPATGEFKGGGIYLITATATLRENFITHNYGQYSGGGMQVRAGHAWLDANTFFSNTVDTYGGGFRSDNNSSVTLSGNDFDSNYSASHSGGVSLVNTTFTVTGNLIHDNLTNSEGGGLAIYYSTGQASGNIIRNNRANANGGGLFLYYGDAVFVNNVIMDNEAAQGGSGIQVQGVAPRFWHTTIARNGGASGTGVFVQNDPIVASGVLLTNTVLVSQSVGVTVALNALNSATLHGVLWYNVGIPTGGPGTISVTGAVSGDPAFAPDGYHLTRPSAAIDQGIPAGVLSDIDGDARPNASLPDLGADEFLWATQQLYLPVVLR